MTTWLVLAANGVHAAEEAPLRAARDLKIDVYAFDPRSQVWGTDWKVTIVEQWTAVLRCAPVAPSIERCRFQGDKVWWTVLVVDDPDNVVTVELPAPGELEWTWTSRNRLKSWDVQGDRTAFWSQASNAAVKHMFHRPDRVFKSDAQRQVGLDIEAALTRALAGAVEWELAKTGAPAAGTTWDPTQSPLVGRRWTQSASSPKITCEATAASGGQGRLAFTMKGTVKEQSDDLGPTPAIVVTTVVGGATWDPRVGGVVEAWFETKAEASGSYDLVGHARTASLVVPWHEGDSMELVGLPRLRLP